MKNYLILLCFTIQCLLVTSKLPFNDCNPNPKYKGDIKDITISGCSGDVTVCPLKKGTNVTVEVNFNEPFNSAELTAEVHGIIANIPVPFPLDNPDGCKDCGINCPVKTGMGYTYKSAIEVKESYPSIQLVVKWELKGGNDDVFCFMVPVEIVS